MQNLTTLMRNGHERQAALEYYIDYTSEQSIANRVLTQLDERFNKVVIYMGEILDDYSAGIYLNTLLRVKHDSLRTLHFMGANIRSYQAPQVIKRTSVNHLTLENCSIHEDVLPLLSPSFQNLEELNFSACLFVEIDELEN